MSMRVPPHNEDAERSVLGAAMISHEAMMNAVEMLRPEDFYNRINKEIYEAIEELYKKKQSCGYNYRFRGAQKKRLS